MISLAFLVENPDLKLVHIFEKNPFVLSQASLSVSLALAHKS
jgi:hypothetical protein